MVEIACNCHFGVSQCMQEYTPTPSDSPGSQFFWEAKCRKGGLAAMMQANGRITSILSQSPMLEGWVRYR